MSEMIYLPVDKLFPHPDNPRKDLGDLTELADSIKANGIYQNLTVIPDGAGYTVIIGHRRLAAAKQAGLTEAPCIVTTMTPREQMQTMLLENMQRSDLNPYEQAQGFQMMLDLGATVEEIAEKTGFSKKTVRSRVKMAELDQDTLRKVSDRQISIGDFDTLAKIEDIEERNKVLDSIGTRDFDQNVSYALRRQKERHNLPLIKKWLKEVGAKKLKDSERFSSKYESYDGRFSISVSRWGEPGDKPPKVGKIPIYYELDSFGSLRLFKKREKATPQRKTPEELAMSKSINEAWDLLDATAGMAYDLRKQFVEKLAVTAKNRAIFLTGALTGALLEAIDFNGPDRDSIYKILGLSPDIYGNERSRQLAVRLECIDEKDLPRLIYALFGDSAKMKCVRYNYRGTYPEYELNIKLNLLYNWLMTLGYEMSTGEMQLLNGEHVGYHAKEASGV